MSSFRGVPANEGNVNIIRFGGGYHTRTSEDEIDPREASGGKNFEIDLENSHLEPRKPFALMGTATNGSDIRGFAQLQKQDGSISTLIQAGTAVYEWDGGSTWTSKGTVSSSAQLRGHLQHNFTLDEKVVITDLSLTENLKTWDGTTFTDATHNLGGALKAKYAGVRDERLYLANVHSGTHTPHMIVGSTQSDMETLTTANKPSSALGASDPFYILSPDLKPINGMVDAFGRLAFSTAYGNMFSLAGSNAKDFYIDELYARSGATGDESVIFAGNDVVYGRHGVIESLAGAEAFGDVENDDFSRQIKNELETYTEFRMVWNPRTKKIFVFPDGSTTIWVFYKAIHDQLTRDVTLLQRGNRTSAWVPWETSHSTATFTPTTVWHMLHPSTKRDIVCFGDASGNVYQMEGDTYDGDGGDTAVRMERLSKNFISPTGRVKDVTGWVRYRSGADVNLTLVFEYGGEQSYDQEITLTLPASSDLEYFNSDAYFSGTHYFGGRFGGRLVSQKISAAGRGSDVRIRAVVESVNDFSIAEIGVEFKA